MLPLFFPMPCLKVYRNKWKKYVAKITNYPLLWKSVFFVLCAFMCNFASLSVCMRRCMMSVHISSSYYHTNMTLAPCSCFTSDRKYFMSRTSMEQCFYNEYRSTLKSSQMKCRINTLLENNKLNKALKHTDKHWQMTIREKKPKILINAIPGRKKNWTLCSFSEKRAWEKLCKFRIGKVEVQADNKCRRRWR